MGYRGDRVRSTRFLLRCGVVGPLLFIVVFLLEGLTRPDYNPYRSMVSELSLSSWGWQQIANFLVCGTLLVAFSIGLRRVHISRWATRVLTVTALGMLMAGLFVCDPGLAYPAGTPDTLPLVATTWHGTLHSMAGVIVFFSLPIGIGIMAAWFGQQHERRWMIYSLATLVLGVVTFMVCNVMAMHGGPAGVFQRICIVIYFTWLARLAQHLGQGGLLAVGAGGRRAAEPRLDASIRHQPGECDDDEQGDGDPAVDERQRNGHRVQHQRHVALEVAADGGGQQRVWRLADQDGPHEEREGDRRQQQHAAIDGGGQRR